MDTDQLTIAAIATRARREFADQTIVSRDVEGVTVRTYEVFFRRVDQLALALRDLGVGPGDRVGTLAWNNHRHLELYFAVTLSGAVLHTINARLSSEQAIAIAQHAGDSVLFHDEDLTPLAAKMSAAVPSLKAVVSLGRTWAGSLDYETLLAAQGEGVFNAPDLPESTPAATCYSSATTGRPKGVVYSHRAIVLHSIMLGLRDTWGVGHSDSVMPVVPMYHVNAWGLPFAALWMGSRLVLPGERPTGVIVADLLVAHQVTVSAAVPTVWMDVFRRLRELQIRLPDLRLLVSGGAPLPRSLLDSADELSIPLIHSYGMTEASPVVLVNNSRETAASPEDEENRRLRQGYVVPGVDYRVLDDNGREVPRDGGSPGELVIRGFWVAEAYEDDPRTKDVFHDGWYHTGDIVTVEPGGCVQIVDRKSDLIKSGGEWISSVELENALMEHPAVDSAAVVSVPDARWQERPRAFVSCSSPVTSEQLQAHLGARFPKFWVPDEIVFVDSIPLTSVGKFDKKQLRSLASTD